MFTDFLEECRTVKAAYEPNMRDVKETYLVEPLGRAA
jgi:hypothetical protein